MLRDKRQPDNTFVETSDGDELLCPYCHGLNLHHGAVSVKNRKQEDGDGIEVAVDGQRLEVFPISGKGFTGRRNEIRIRFQCEACGSDTSAPKLELVIMQNKGSTYLWWETQVMP